MSSKDSQNNEQKSDSSPRVQSKEPPLFLAFLSIACGVYPLLLSLDVIPGGSESLNVPVWIGVLASSIFIVAGLALLAKNIKWLNQLLGISIVVIFAIIGNWIAFGVGERTCGMAIFAFSEEVTGLMCRIPFGYGAILLNGVIVVLSLSSISKRLANQSISVLLEKSSGIILLVVLLPFLIFLVVPIVFKEFKARFFKT